MPETAETQTQLLAITPDDRLVHVGMSAPLLVHVVEEEKQALQNGEPTPDWEFYDSEGRVHILVRDATGKATGFEIDPTAPEPTDESRILLVDRLAVFQERVQLVLDRQIADGKFEGDTIPRRRTPQVRGELQDVLTALEALAGATPDTGEPHAGSWLHNLWHAAFG